MAKTQNMGQLDNRAVNKNPGDITTPANTGVCHTGPDFEKHVFQENPGKWPDGERKIRDQVENRVLKTNP